MKTENEIRDEIKACETTIKNFSNAYKNGIVDKKLYIFKKEECNNMILALKWVLGENDRYD